MVDKELEARILEEISIPQYYSLYIDSSVNLNVTNNVCSPFRQEDTPSFYYSKQKGIWKDFGGDKYGGNVIALHYRWKKCPSYAEAVYSLASLLGIKFTREKTVTLNDIYAKLSKIECKRPTIKDAGKIEYTVLNSMIERILLEKDSAKLYTGYDYIMSYDLPQDTKIILMTEFYESIKGK